MAAKKTKPTIQVRKPETLDNIRQLQEQLGVKTATGLIDVVVSEYPDLVKEIKRAKERISLLENHLSDMITVIKNKKEADDQFGKVIHSIFEEGLEKELGLLSRRFDYRY